MVRAAFTERTIVRVQPSSGPPFSMIPSINRARGVEAPAICLGVLADAVPVKHMCEEALPDSRHVDGVTLNHTLLIPFVRDRRQVRLALRFDGDARQQQHLGNPGRMVQLGRRVRAGSGRAVRTGLSAE